MPKSPHANWSVWSLLHLEDNDVVYGPKVSIDKIEKIVNTLQPPIKVIVRVDNRETIIKEMAFKAKESGCEIHLEDNRNPRHPIPHMNDDWSMVRYRGGVIINGKPETVTQAINDEIYGYKQDLIVRYDLKRYIIDEALYSAEIQRKYDVLLLEPVARH